MTVAEIIVWLQTQDQEAIVQVVRHTSGRSYYDQGGNAKVMDFTVGEIAPYTYLFDYSDLRGNQFVTPDKSYYNQRTLLLGEING